MLIRMIRHGWKEPFIRMVLSGGMLLLLGAGACEVYTAKYVYEDWRCVLAECRIVNNCGTSSIVIGDED
jgi:hypothetical protein